VPQPDECRWFFWTIRDRGVRVGCPIVVTALDWLNRVPATFWGVIVGSFFTLGGITLTNRNTAKNLRIQREMDLRKEVYLATAEAIAAGTLALGRMANINTQHEALDDFNKVAPAIAKVYVIGRIVTIDAVVAVHAALTSGILRLSGYVMPLIILRNRVAGMSSRIDSFLATQKGLLEQIGEERLRGVPDHPKWDELQRQFKFETDRLNDAISEKAGVEREFADAQLLLSRSAIDESEKVNRVLPAAIAAVREELEMHPFDPDAFAAILQRNFQQQKQIFAQIVAVAQELISKANRPPAPRPPPKPPEINNGS
jgi:hypothetical protein